MICVATASNLTGIICILTNLALATIPVLVGLALLLFFWGLASWILNVGSEEEHKKGKQRMIWGLVALFFILSISGVIAVLQNTFFGGGAAGVQNHGQVQSGGTTGPVGGIQGGQQNAGWSLEWFFCLLGNCKTGNYEL